MYWTDLDPLAVKVTFHYTGHDVHWMFALDLLTTITGGTAVRTGDCDVQTTWERGRAGEKLFALQLSSPAGTIKLVTPLAEVLEFAVEVEDKLPADGVLETMVDYELDYELAAILKEADDI
jgi:hypothetical protein